MTTVSTFAPHSPGAWELEQTHLSRAISVYMAEVFPKAMISGFSDGARAYGVLLDHLDVAIVNRFVYLAPRPVGAPKNAKGPPPRLVMTALLRLHPELRRRVTRSATVFRDRFWREDLAKWHAEVKPSMAARARALLQDDVSRCSTSELVDHVRRATEFLSETVYWHHRYNMCAMIPLGDFLVQVMDWTGLAAPEILQVLRGKSHVSVGAVEELAELRRAIQMDGGAMAKLLSDRAPAEIIRDLQQRDAPVGPAARQYLDVVGLRILGGYDVADRHASEHPDLLLKILRSAATADDTMRQAEAEQAIARLRDRVPASHRATFDDLLQEAQITYGIRDERIFHGDALGAGIARRAILAAGERLHAQGRVLAADHLVDATRDEIVALLEGRDGPSAQELAARTRFRLETPLSTMPARLGFPSSAPPPAEWLPPAAARMQRIINLVLSLMFDTHAAPSGSKSLKGFGVSPGVYEGSARVIRGIDELPSVQAGEVLVTPATGPTFNVVLPLIGALVTERGGALSHAAIVAREYGLPGVVGCPGATTTIKTGTRIRVDGQTGEVWINV